MRSSDREVPILIGHAKIMSDSSLIFWFFQIHDGLHLFGSRHDAIFGQNIAKVFNLVYSKVGFGGIYFQACLLKSLKYVF